VLLVGKTEGLDGGSLSLRTSDDKLVRVTLKAHVSSITSDFLEFEAKVDTPDSVTEVEHTGLGNSFGECPPFCKLAACADRRSSDLKNYNALVKCITGADQALFY
jgi:hypothetical protein